MYLQLSLLIFSFVSYLVFFEKSKSYYIYLKQELITRIKSLCIEVESIIHVIKEIKKDVMDIKRKLGSEKEQRNLAVGSIFKLEPSNTEPVNSETS